MAAYYDSAGNVANPSDAEAFQLAIRAVNVTGGGTMAAACGTKLAADTPGSYACAGTGAN